MVKEKVVKISGEEVRYSEDRWQLLAKFRQTALKYARALHESGLNSLTYGSIARGNIKPSSDIDIVLVDRIPSYR